MLIQFNFKNFKSFREEATLDLSAAKMTEFSNRVVLVGGEKFCRLLRFMAQMQAESLIYITLLNI